MKTSPAALSDELSLQFRQTSSYNHNSEPYTVFQTDGLLPKALIGRLSLQYRQTSSCIPDDEPFTVQQTGGLLPTMLNLTSPPPYFKQTGSSLLLLLTSHPLNTNERALIDHKRRALRCTSNRRAPPYNLHRRALGTLSFQHV